MAGAQRPYLSRSAHVPTTPPAPVREVLSAPGRALDPGIRAMLEPRLGHDFSRVRIHHDDAAARAADTMRAHAFTRGRQVVLGRGGHRPETTEGLRLLAHELAHVVQQGSPPTSTGGARSDPGAESLEREADRAADLALAGRTVPRGMLTAAPAVLQRKEKSKAAEDAEERHRAIQKHVYD